MVKDHVSFLSPLYLAKNKTYSNSENKWNATFYIAIQFTNAFKKFDPSIVIFIHNSHYFTDEDCPTYKAVICQNINDCHDWIIRQPGLLSWLISNTVLPLE